MCEISFEGDAWQAWQQKTRKARKRYVCDCCGGAIPSGAHYVATSWIDADRRPGSERSCLQCDAALDEFAAEHDFSVAAPSYFRHLLLDCIVDDDEESRRWDHLLIQMDTRAFALAGVSP